jgi:hypothetical protein
MSAYPVVSGSETADSAIVMRQIESMENVSVTLWSLTLQGLAQTANKDGQLLRGS